MKFTLRFTGFVGLLFFLSLFTLTYGVPKALEDSAKSFIKKQIEMEVRDTISPIADSSLVKKTKHLADRLGFQESRLKQDLVNGLPEKIASIMAKMCGYDCEKKKQLTDSIKSNYLNKIKNLQLGQYNLSEIVKGKYVEVVSNLKTDIRIFTFSNALMFLILVLISLFKPNAIQHLFIPGALLFIATLVSVIFYVFGQDWFYTIIYNNYMGFAYLAYLGIIFGFLIDIVLNKCRVTSQVFNFLSNAISSIGSVSPC